MTKAAYREKFCYALQDCQKEYLDGIHATPVLEASPFCVASYDHAYSGGLIVAHPSVRVNASETCGSAKPIYSVYHAIFRTPTDSIRLDAFLATRLGAACQNGGSDLGSVRGILHRIRCIIEHAYSTPLRYGEKG